MYLPEQELLLEKFADSSDKLLELGIISTDSFTGEIGEYVVCRYFNLKKTARVTRAVDGICALGKNYQVKAKVISNNNFNYSIKTLDTSSFDFLTVVYFDRLYNPLKILRIPSNKISNGEISITATLIKSGIEVIDKSLIIIPAKERKAINGFAKCYDDLQLAGIIRSRQIVGDIGEFYACRQLSLEICHNKTEKGLDARHKSGLTFEIKTRRVYESERRDSSGRRLNNLVGKSADFLIVVTLDRCFKCSGMWLIPMKNLINPKSAKLQVVNETPGAKNIIASRVSGLNTGEKFKSFDQLNTARTFSIEKKNKLQVVSKAQNQVIAKPAIKIRSKKRKDPNAPDFSGFFAFMFLLVIIIIIYKSVFAE